MDLVHELNRKKDAEQNKAHDERIFTVAQFTKVASAVEEMSRELRAFIKSHEPKVEVKNFPAYPTLDNTNVVKAIKAIPEAKLDTKDLLAAVIVLTKEVKEQAKLIKALEVKPEVNIDAPIVNVKEPDLKPILKAIKDIPVPEPTDLSKVQAELKNLASLLKANKRAIDDKPVPQVAITPTDPLVRYVASDLDEASATKYYGFVDTGGTWGIREVTSTTIRYAFGNSNYETAWTDRATQTYKRWGK